MSNKGLRSVRRDGNCAYRAIGFAVGEALKSSSDSDWQSWSIVNLRETLKQLMLDVGYELYAIEDFHQMFVETVVDPLTVDALIEAFQTEYMSDTVVCFLRLVCAAHLKKVSS